jgi:hypothetical protein
MVSDLMDDGAPDLLLDARGIVPGDPLDGPFVYGDPVRQRHVVETALCLRDAMIEPQQSILGSGGQPDVEQVLAIRPFLYLHLDVLETVQELLG